MRALPRSLEPPLRTAFLALLALAAAGPALAGDLTPKSAAEVLGQIDKGLDTYVDPAVAKRAQALLKAHRAQYLKLDTREAFAQAVTTDLYAATHDGHLKLRPVTLDASAQARLTPEQEALLDRRAANGLLAIRRLPANIGYLKLSGFAQDEAGAALIDAAIRLLKDTDALIIDLRANGGGGGAADEELLGQLSAAPIPMATIHWRNPDGSETLWQRKPRTPAGGPLYADKPVFVLTAHYTFSAAEGFAYDLKNAHRAVLVGETTGGGANPSNRPVPLSYGFRIFIPNGRVVHPTTGTNWEGVGVAPDVAVPADQALTEAYGMALKAARPLVSTVSTEAERARVTADPKAALLADQPL